MAWTTPVTSWSTSDGILNSDMNRIEGNNLQNRTDAYNSMLPHVQGFEIFANDGSVATGAYEVAVWGYHASCTTTNVTGFISLDSSSYHRKQLSATSFTPGSGATTAGKAPGATYADDKWFYLYVLKNPTTSAIDFCFDDSHVGNNITGSTIETTHGFTLHRRIGALKTTSLSSTNGFVPTVGHGNKFWMGGIYNPRYDTISTSDTVGHTWVLQDSTSAYIIPPSGVVCRNFYASVLLTTGSGTIYLWDPTFGTTVVTGQGLFVANSTTAHDVYLQLPASQGQINMRNSLSGSTTWSMRVEYYVDSYMEL